MIEMPLAQIIGKIKDSSGLSDEEINTKIKKKLDELAGLISEEGAAHIVANELGVKLQDPDAPVTISKLIAGMRNVEIVGKVKQVYEIREFNNERRSGKVGNFLMVDETGITRVVMWNEQADQLKELSTGDVVKIKGAYVRDNQGRVEIHVSESTGKFYKNPEGVEIKVDVNQTPQAQNKHIAELSEQDQNVTVVATIVQVFDPRFFATCPECRGRAREEDGGYVCASHGQVKPNYNYVMNIVLDDGSDNTRCVLWREQAAQLLGKNDEEVLAMKDSPADFEPFKTELLGMIVEIRGRVNRNEAFGKLELVAYEVKKDVDPSTVTDTSSKTTTVEEREEVTAVVDDADNKVEELQTSSETTIEKASEPPKKTPAASASTADEEDDVFTLEDLEDLDD